MYCAYLRKSTDREDMQVQSIEIQQEWIENASKLRGKFVDKSYEDRASAKKPENRPEFTQLLKEIEKGKWEGIYCISLDRLARNMPEAGRICYALQTGMIKEIITRDATYIPSTDTLILSMHFGISTQYSRNLSAKTSDGMNKSANKGKWMFWTPSGYENRMEPQTRVKFVQPSDSFPYVQKMFKLALAGKSQQEIGDTLYEEGFRTRPTKRSPLPKKVSKTSISEMLRNKFYCGMVRDLSGEWHPGEHEPAVGHLEFEDIQKLIQRKYVKQDKIFAFRGLLKCGECDSTVTSQIQKGHTYYHCNKKKKKCSQKYTLESDLNESFSEYLKTIEIPEKLKEIGKQAIIDKNRINKYIVQVDEDQNNRKRLSINDQLSNLVDMRSKNEITSERFIEKQAELEKQLEELSLSQSEKDSLNNNQIRQSSLWLELLESLSVSYNKQQYPEKGIILKMIGQNWIVKDGKVACESLNPLFETAQKYHSVRSGGPLKAWLEHFINQIVDNIDEIETILSRLSLA